MSNTRRWKIPRALQPDPPSAEPVRLVPQNPPRRPPPDPDEQPPLYTLRGQVRALDEESEPMNTTAITLWECSALSCSGVAIYGDRLEDHTAWHRSRRRET